jgi:hypothetical protein
LRGPPTSTWQLVILTGSDKDRCPGRYDGAGHMVGRHSDAAHRVNDPPRLALPLRDPPGRRRGHPRREPERQRRLRQPGAGESRLKPGDVVQVGETLLRLEAADDAVASTVSGICAPAEYDVRGAKQLAELSGRTLSHFQIGPVLGKGEIGLVFPATDTNDGKPVALKVMQPAFSKDEDDVQRFVRAMKAMLHQEVAGQVSTAVPYLVHCP